MAWTTPKTNWTSTDYFNIEDYNRIKANIQALKELSVEVYPDYTLGDMGADKAYSDGIYADEFNLFESNLEKIKDSTYPFVIGTMQTYKANNKIPDYVELNRIESGLLLIKQNIEGQISGRPQLEFTLNGGIF